MSIVQCKVKKKKGYINIKQNNCAYKSEQNAKNKQTK